MGRSNANAKVMIPGPSGPHAVGTLRYDVTGEGYEDPYAPSPVPRRVPVQAWYPARATGGATEPALDDELRSALSALTRMPRVLVRPGHSYAVPNAPAVPDHHPVLIFNHGYGSFQKQSTSLMTELASNGYLVLSVGHPYESLAVRFGDGTVVSWRRDLPAWRVMEAGLKDLEHGAREVAPLIAQARMATDAAALLRVMQDIAALPSYAALVTVLETWTHDTRLVIDTLDRLDGGELAAPLRGIVDAGRIGVFGHSLGGILAGQLAMTEPRVGAGMSFDGAQLPPPGAGYALAAPFCFVYADATVIGRTTVVNEGMNDALALEGPAGSCGVCIAGAAHLNFTDMNNVAAMAKALGRIDRGVMARTLRAMTLGFFDHHLKGRPLTGLTPSDTLRVHRPSPVAEVAAPAPG